MPLPQGPTTDRSDEARRQAVRRVVALCETALHTASTEDDPILTGDVLVGLLTYFQILALAYVESGVGDPSAITRNLEAVAVRIAQAYQTAHPIISAGADLLM